MTTVIILAWALFGALVGVSAAQTRGFSVVAGVIGGLLLGPLALLLFAASDSAQQKCPTCAEWIKAEATICKHCHQPVHAAAGPRIYRSREAGMRHKA